jgi:hypothetical protein
MNPDPRRIDAKVVYPAETKLTEGVLPHTSDCPHARAQLCQLAGKNIGRAS